MKVTYVQRGRVLKRMNADLFYLNEIHTDCVGKIKDHHICNFNYEDTQLSEVSFDPLMGGSWVAVRA